MKTQVNRHLVAVVSALGPPGVSTVAVVPAVSVPRTTAAVMWALSVMPLLMRSTRAVAGFGWSPSSFAATVLPVWRYFSWLLVSSPLALATVVVVFGWASMPTVAAGLPTGR